MNYILTTTLFALTTQLFALDRPKLQIINEGERTEEVFGIASDGKQVPNGKDSAMKAGLWKGKYASMNHHEFFAEGVQSWFDNNPENDHDHNHVNTRAELLEYDPGLAALCREVFGDTELKYTKPTTRLTDHLKGYDPAKAPNFT